MEDTQTYEALSRDNMEEGKDQTYKRLFVQKNVGHIVDPKAVGLGETALVKRWDHALEKIV